MILRVRSTNSFRQTEKRFGIASNPVSEKSPPEIDDEVRIGAEMVRVLDDMVGNAEVSRVATKIAQARVDPAFAENEAMREDTLVFLEGPIMQSATRCTAAVHMMR